jgi:PEGA domain
LATSQEIPADHEDGVIGMSYTRAAVRATVAGAVTIALMQPLPLAVAMAQEDRASVREAATHFQRGVTLYGETDYRGALVEFNRAYALAPGRVVLYNIGQTDYQLRDYAGALTMFERYLAETGPSDSHRTELEHSVKELKARVGRLTVVTIPPGAEVSIDERVVGKTPFERPVIVSMGRLKVSATAAGRAPLTRYLDIAAEDDVSLTLELPTSVPAASVLDTPTTSTAVVATSVPPATEVTRSRSPGPSWRTAGWISTGVLAGGAIVFGLVALQESSDLKAQRDVFRPSTGALAHRANLTTTFAVLSDSFAAAAIIVGGLTLYSTLGSGAEAQSTRVAVGIGSLALRGTF